MGKIHVIKQERDAALAHARSIAETGTAAELREASVKVEETQRALVAHIVEGAAPCPRCKSDPVGMEQPTGRGAAEYEIGCPVCTYFVHDDGSLRMALVRGGLMPKHAVELWNMGVDYWAHVPPHKEKDARAIILQLESAADAREKQAALDAEAKEKQVLLEEEALRGAKVSP